MAKTEHVKIGDSMDKFQFLFTAGRTVNWQTCLAISSKTKPSKLHYLVNKNIIISFPQIYTQ